MHKYLYLDDVRSPIEGDWIIARNYDEFVEIINKEGLENFKVISLDHDLGDSAMREFYNNVYVNDVLDYNNIEEKTGLDCAKFLIELSMNSNKKMPQIYVHSANPIGSVNIIELINNYFKFNGLDQNCMRVNIPHTINE